MSALHSAREEPSSPSPQKLGADDSDSGFHELIDDAAVFELSLPKDSESPLSAAESPLQILEQPTEEHVPTQFRLRGANGSSSSGRVSLSSAASYTGTSTPEYSPISPSPRPLLNGTDSVSSTASTQPDTGVAGASGQLGEDGGIAFTPVSPAPSPADSVEDVSGKGEAQC